MLELNSLILEGTVTEDAKFIEDDKLCKFNLKYHGVKDDSIFPVEVYGNTAAFAASKAVKNRVVRLVGKIKLDRWSDENGKEQSRFYILAEHLEYKPMTTKIGKYNTVK